MEKLLVSIFSQLANEPSRRYDIDVVGRRENESPMVLSRVIMCDRTAELTVLLHEARCGNSDADVELFEAVKSRLHAMAERQLNSERAGNSLQATVLVDDVYLQLVGKDQLVDWKDRNHFFVLAAKAMRRIRVDHARARQALKRGGKMRRVDVEFELQQDAEDSDVLNLHEALERLRAFDLRQANIVELRFFGGYSLEETANLLGVSVSTVNQEFVIAKGWLFRELSGD